MKKRGIIARLVMGKEREDDLTVADLPANRPQQFKFVMRTRFGMIFRETMLCSLFWLPLLVWSLVSSLYFQRYVASLSVDEYFSRLINLSLLQFGVEIPMFMIAFVGLAGLFYTVKRICWGQSLRVVADFGAGIKNNWLHFLILGTLGGVLNLVMRYLITALFLMTAAMEALLWGLAITALILLAIVLAVVFMYACCMITLYRTSFMVLLKNCFILCFKKLWSSIGINVLSLSLVLPFAIMPWFIAKIIGIALAIVISIGFAATVQTVFCHGVFDKYINAKSYPDYMNIGLASGKLPEDLLFAADSDGEEGEEADETEEVEEAEESEQVLDEPVAEGATIERKTDGADVLTSDAEGGEK